MADNRRNMPTPQLDSLQILFYPYHWLQPTAVYEILRNYKKYRLAPDPPHKPTGGSMFLFDRKALRHFRKDSLNWQKKKDGKRVREGHVKLKVDSIDVLNCYYARGEDNENFQRRCYWMLDEQYKHIVLVHYREVKESCSNIAEGEFGDDVGGAFSLEGEASSDEESSLRQLSENKELVVDSSVYQPQTDRKTFANCALDKMGYGQLNASGVGPEQHPLLGRKQPLQGQFSKQIDGSPFGEYSGRQIFSSIVTTGFDGLSMQTKNVDVGGSRINNGHENNPPTGRSALESSTCEDIQRTQGIIAMQAYVSSDAGRGLQTYTDAHHQPFARGNMQNNAEQADNGGISDVHSQNTSNSKSNTEDQDVLMSITD